jgi:diguanylate cyclase (GGDEF)-like protein
LLAIAIAGGSVIIGISLYSSARIDDRVQRASTETTAALMAADIQESIDSMYVLGLSARLDGAAMGDPDTPVITIERAIQGHDTMQFIVEEAAALDDLVATAETEQIRALSVQSQDQVEAFLLDPSTERLAGLVETLPELRALTEQEATRLSTLAEQDEAALRDTVVLTRWSTTLVMVITILGMAAATMLIGRRLAEAARVALREKEQLLDATTVLERRNQQFGALYQVISEVTESLNLRYVVATTIQEAQRLVRAEIVGVRRLEGSVLELAEVSTDSHEAKLGPVLLGQGLTGRAAKRGRTIRVDARAFEQMADGEHIAGIESGIVVPLIVGARIVGTLSCWSYEADHFTSDDQRILEMMASQVATAISSASMHEVTQEQASHDALTRLPNRRQLADDIAGPLAAAVAQGERLAIGMADIDHFKRFNDEFGHRVGDVTLQKVAEVLRSSVRDGDSVYRFGGEEFLIVLRAAGRDEARTLAERLRASVERTPLTGDQLQPVGPVTISIGLALCPEHGLDLNALIDAADRAMYASKEMGRNRVTVAGDETDSRQLAA